MFLFVQNGLEYRQKVKDLVKLNQYSFRRINVDMNEWKPPEYCKRVTCILMIRPQQS